MSTFLKRMIFIMIFVISTLVLTGYIAYRFYNYAVQDATARIRKGVEEGVGGAVNPLKWPSKLFGGGE